MMLTFVLFMTFQIPENVFQGWTLKVEFVFFYGIEIMKDNVLFLPLRTERKYL